MDNPWGLGGKNPWKKDKKEPKLNKDEKNPWGLTGEKPWEKEETDKERIARLEKEVNDLKNNNKKEQDDDQTGNDDIASKGKKKSKKSGGMGCLFWFALIALGIYFLVPDKEKVPSNKSSSTTETKTTTEPKPSKYGEIGDNNKYTICYGEMTKLYKANGLHKSNRSASIEAKETICRAYSRGEQSGYPKL